VAEQEGKTLRGVGPIGEFPTQKHAEKRVECRGRSNVALLPEKQKRHMDLFIGGYRRKIATGQSVSKR
jgi:hypothetical protein